ncbi:MAG: hypothetical protein V3R96_05635 [Dehalococcoidales bacterium]
MTDKKYSQYVLPAPIMRVQHEGKNATGYNFSSVYAHNGELDSDHTLGFHYITEPYTEVYPHTHEGHEILCFIGGNPENINEFDAEIELLLGEEGESHVITSPSVFSLPPGLVHGPLTFHRVTKPVFFLEVTLIPKGKYEIIPG